MERTMTVRQRRQWPLTWADAGRFVVAFLLITAPFVVAGLLVTGPLDHSLGDLDRRIARSMADSRTPTLNDVSLVGSWLAETLTKVVFTAIVAGLVFWKWREWRDVLLIVCSLLLEAACFLTITLIVERPRPPVPHLDGSPVNSSFPSGHTAAAVVYGAMVIVIARHVRRRGVVIALAVLTALVAFTVAWARMYRGMHHLSDVVAGVLLGLISLAATWYILERTGDRA